MQYDLEIQADGGWIRTGLIGGTVVIQIYDQFVPTHQFTLCVSDILAIAGKLENPPVGSPAGSPAVGFSSGFMRIVSDGAFFICMDAENITRSCTTTLRLTTDQARELAEWLRSHIPKVPIPTWQDKARARRDKGLEGVFG